MVWMQPVIDAWTDLKGTEAKLSRFAESLDMPNDRMLRAQVRTAAVEVRKVVALLEEALSAAP